MFDIEILKIVQPVIHYSFHFLLPGLVSILIFRKIWKKAWLIMVATMLVDLDHLLASPIFDPGRCSIGFHLLHTPQSILVYILLLFFPKTRIIGVGLLLHMLTDYIDCNIVLWLTKLF